MNRSQLLHRDMGPLSRQLCPTPRNEAASGMMNVDANDVEPG